MRKRLVQHEHERARVRGLERVRTGHVRKRAGQHDERQVLHAMRKRNAIDRAEPK